MSDYKLQIGTRIKAARLLKGLTQDSLAEKLDVSTSCISRYETGVAVASIATLIRIAQILDVGIEYLLYDYTSQHAVFDPLTSEICMHIQPMPENYKKHLLDVVKSLAENLPIQEDQTQE